jgi:hypothetical protein
MMESYDPRQPIQKPAGLNEESKALLRGIARGFLWLESFTEYTNNMPQQEFDEAVGRAVQRERKKSCIEMVEISPDTFEMKQSAIRSPYC